MQRWFSTLYVAHIALQAVTLLQQSNGLLAQHCPHGGETNVAAPCVHEETATVMKAAPD
jgi:hypothetical protein